MNHDHTPPQVTVEQLLRLKRTERPAPEFWQDFERQMRAKQLAAIVEPRPWWAPFIRVSTRLARYQLPVGAAAVLALTFITVREYPLPESDVGLSPNTVATKVDTMPGPAVTATTAPAHSPVGVAMEQNHEQVALTATEAKAAASTLAARSQSAPDQIAGLVPLLGTSFPADAAPAEYSPAARAIAANLAAVKASEPELVQLMERVPGMDSIINPPARTPIVDPLVRIQAPSESRRTARLLASALPAVSYSSEEASGHVPVNRIERSLTEDRLYDSISRFGVKGDRVAVSF